MSDNKINLQSREEEAELDFYDGQIEFSAYSYYIDSHGHGSLTREQTRELYEAMKNYYEGGSDVA